MTRGMQVRKLQRTVQITKKSYADSQIIIDMHGMAIKSWHPQSPMHGEKVGLFTHA